MGAIRNFATGGGDGLLRNNAVLDRATKKFGSAAIRFDGASQGFVRTSETFALGAINWCLECWVSLAATQPNTTVTIAQISSPLPDQYGSGYISIQASGGLSVVAWDFNASAPLIATAINLYGAGWKHIALSRQGSTWRLFVDGAEVGAGTWAGSVGGATNALFVGGHPYGNAGMSGWADDIRLTLGQARYTANFTAPDRELPQAAPIGPGGIDQDYASVSVLLDFDAAIEDDSSNQFAVTASGSIAISAVEKKFGTHSLNCAGGHLVLPTSAKFELRASERWTIEFWVYTSTSYAPVIWSGGSANEIILTGPGRNNVMYAPSHWNPGGDAAVVGSSVAIPANTWTHIALVAESASVGKLYVGGQLGATVGAIGVDLKYIGGNGGVVGSSAFSGYLDDVRVTKGVARYTANFTPATTGFTAPPSVGDSSFNSVTLLLPLDADFSDASNATPTITSQNVVISSLQSKYGAASAFFSGTSNNFIRVAIDSNIQFGTGPFTIECWAYQTDQSGIRALFDFNEAQPFRVIWEAGAVKVQHTSSGTTVITSIQPFPINAWNHVALVRAGNDVALYINGVSGGSWTTTASLSGASGQGLWIGNNRGDTWFWAGYIDDFRITTGVARYTGAFTPPTYASPTSLVGAGGGDTEFEFVTLLANFNGSNSSTTFSDSSLNPLTLTAVGNAKLSTSQKKYGSASLALDGDGDYVTITPASSVNIGNEDFTVECWFLLNALNVQAICAFNGAVFNGLSITVYNGSLYAEHNGVGMANQSAGITTGTWYHVALARSGSTYRLFLDGVQMATSSATPFSVTYTTAVIGNMIASGSTPIPVNGYIDDFRITRGIARYTANFTPPTAELPSTLQLGTDDLFNNVKVLYLANTYTAPAGRSIDDPILVLSELAPGPVELRIGDEAAPLGGTQFFGRGKIAGTVKVSGTPNVPVARRVRLLEEASGTRIADVTSNNITGAYAFEHLSTDYRYTVIAYDDEKNYRAVIADSVTPEVALDTAPDVAPVVS